MENKNKLYLGSVFLVLGLFAIFLSSSYTGNAAFNRLPSTPSSGNQAGIANLAGSKFECIKLSAPLAWTFDNNGNLNSTLNSSQVDARLTGYGNCRRTGYNSLCLIDRHKMTVDKTNNQCPLYGTNIKYIYTSDSIETCDNKPKRIDITCRVGYSQDISYMDEVLCCK